MTDGWLISAADVWDDVVALITFPGEFLEITAAMPIGERFNRIKNNYRRKQAMVDAGIDDWFHSDPYEVGNWCAIFTPIESALWCDIRGMGLDLWPQLPVGRFFVDFGNPVAKVAIECDGKEWHLDAAKDCARDQELEAMGWEVLRIPGWQCKRPILNKSEAEEKHGIDPEEFECWRDHETPYTSLAAAREYLEPSRRRSEVAYRKKMALKCEARA